MFKNEYAKTKQYDIFTKYKIPMVIEDYYKVKENIFCVADGVTRDRVDGKVTKYKDNQEELQETMDKYPNPSGAFEAAKITCETFIKEMEENKEEITEQTIRKCVEKANKEVAKINEGREIDYIKEDYYCCVAVGGKIEDNILYAFSIGDCHIDVLDENYQVLFTTKNNHKDFENYLEEVYIKQHSYDWTNPEDRVRVRKEYRNKPDKKYQGKDISFGVISGEEVVDYYVDTYKIPLDKAYYICAYSDGCEPDFKTKETRQYIIENTEEAMEKGKEKTLVVYKKQD